MAAVAVAGRKNWSAECRNLWRVAGPVILAQIFQFGLGFVTVAFVGHIGKVELAAVYIVNGVVEGLAFGLLLGMGSALETLCGQAVGAGQAHMLGVYMQRSWIICLATSLLLLPIYVFTAPLLRLLRQSPAIAEVSGRYARWCVPQLFAYAVNFPIQKFYQAQSRVWVMTAVSGAVLGVHALLNWVVVARFGRGKRVLVAAHRGAVRARRRRVVPGGVDGVLAQGVRQPLRVRQALRRVGCHAVVRPSVACFFYNYSVHRVET
jgi:multidrug resistance protein, MATE family